MPSKRKRWLQRLYGRRCHHWKAHLEKIDNPYLKVKVACIVFWDSTSEEAKGVNPEEHKYLRKLCEYHRPYYEEHYTEDQVMQELLKLGYPVKGQNGAYSRSRKPKIYRG